MIIVGALYVNIPSQHEMPKNYMNDDKNHSFELNSDFWEFLDRIILTNQVMIDRSKGTAHPRYPQMVYPFDYGYLKGTVSNDGFETDVWIGSNPNKRLAGVLLTVDLMKQDIEVKLLLGCTNSDVERILEFTNGQSMQAKVVFRDR
jgi:inorganic pyrophosphatase